MISAMNYGFVSLLFSNSVSLILASVYVVSFSIMYISVSK